MGDAKGFRNIGFIGTGNMGGALVRGLVSSGFPPENVAIYEIDSAKAQALCDETGASKVDSMFLLLETSDVVVLAVKPYSMRDVLESISTACSDSPCSDPHFADKLFVTIAAGIHTDYCRRFLWQDVKIIRAMPNTAVFVKEGMTVISATETVTDADIDLAFSIFKSVGRVERIDERFMNDVIALTASSPAYIYSFIEIMADWAARVGMPWDMSCRLASQAVLGAAKMVLETGVGPRMLKDQVATPGGTTIEALGVFESKGLADVVKEAMDACSKKAAEISAKFGVEN